MTLTSSSQRSLLIASSIFILCTVNGINVLMCDHKLIRKLFDSCLINNHSQVNEPLHVVV